METLIIYIGEDRDIVFNTSIFDEFYNRYETISKFETFYFGYQIPGVDSGYFELNKDTGDGARTNFNIYIDSFRLAQFTEPGEGIFQIGSHSGWGATNILIEGKLSIRQTVEAVAPTTTDWYGNTELVVCSNPLAD